MTKYSIYCHTFPNGKMYFGQTCQKPESRGGINGAGYKPAKNRNTSKIGNAICKYGGDNIKHEILFANLDKKDADFIEIFLIKRFDSIKKGYNITEGGGGTKGKEVGKLVSAALKDNPNLCTKSRFKKGCTPWNRGKTGFKMSEETRRKMSESKMGKKNPGYGHHEKRGPRKEIQ